MVSGSDFPNSNDSDLPEIELPSLEDSTALISNAPAISTQGIVIEHPHSDPQHPPLAEDDDEKTDPGIQVHAVPKRQPQVQPRPAEPLPTLSLARPAAAAPGAPTGAPAVASSAAPTVTPATARPRPAQPAPAAATPFVTVKGPITPSIAATPPAATAKMPEMGPIDAYMKDPDITEIMVNDVRNVMVEKNGKLLFSGFSIQTLEEVNRLARAILDITGRILSPDSPYVDTMLPDGSRVNIIGPPLTVGGPCITIRKFPTRSYGLEELVRMEMLDRKMAHFLTLCVAGKLNILISGGTGSGKTTLLGALIAFIPKSERIVTIEDTPELAISHFNSVRLQTKPQSPASPPITTRELVANALRMRPDRLIVGECRRGEAFDMLQAMHTGHEGSMTTIHANSARDALSRLETLCMMSGLDIPMVAIRKQLQSAIDLIVQVKRFRNGRRRVIGIAEVTGMEGDTVTLQDIFEYETQTRSGAGEAGRFRFTGLVPTFLETLRERGVNIPKNYFS